MLQVWRIWTCSTRLYEATGFSSAKWTAAARKCSEWIVVARFRLTGFRPSGILPSRFRPSWIVPNNFVPQQQFPPAFVPRGQQPNPPAHSTASSSASAAQPTNNVRPIHEKYVKTCIELKYKGQQISALVDTGSDVSIAGEDVARKYGCLLYTSPSPRD